MSKNQKKTTIVNAQVELADYAVESLSKLGTNLTEVVSNVADKLVDLFSRGGFMMSPEDVTRMTKATKQPVDNAAKVVELVESTGGIRKGHYSHVVNLDPSIAASFEDMARQRGTTLENIIQECWDGAAMNGWFYAIPPETTQFCITPQQKAELVKVLGKSTFHGTDIVDYIKKVAK